MSLLCVSQLIAEETNIVGDIYRFNDRLEFAFETTSPVGTNFQPQYSATLDGEWMDIPDASILEFTDVPGRYYVIVPTFGEDVEFFRVVDANTSEEAPIAPTLGEPAPAAEDQIMLLLNSERVGSRTVSGKFYSYAEASPDGELPASLRPLERNEFDDELKIGDSNAQDSLSVDLTGNGVPDPVLCWANEANKLVLVLPQVNGEGQAWGAPHVYNVPGPAIYTASLNAPAIIRMVSLQLDNDDLLEVALAYKDETATIQLMTIDFNGDVSSAPTFSAPDSSTQLDTGDLIRSARFDLAAGNFDNDSEGIDEIVLVTTMPVAVDGGADNFRLYSKFFHATTSALTHIPTITPEESELYFKSGRSTIWLNRVAAVAEDFNGDGIDDLAVGFMVRNNSSQGFWYLQAFNVDTDLQNVFNLVRAADNEFNVRAFHQTTGSPGHPMTLLPVQLDDDIAYELLYSARSTDFWEFDVNLEPEDIGGGSVPAESASDSRRHVVFANLETPQNVEDYDYPEVISIREFDVSQGSGNTDLSKIEITMYRIVRQEWGAYTLDKISSIEDEVIENNNLGRAFALSIAPFDALDLKLGIPRRSTRTIANRPTVILNAPPIHFDVLDGVEYDVNNLFPIRDLPPQGSPFLSRFTRQNTEKVTVEAQWKRSWDVSIKASGGFGIPLTPVQVEAEVRTKFGQDFDSYSEGFETTTITVEIEAVDDAQLYATTLSYDIWEYPVILNGNTIVGNIILIDPSVQSHDWFSSKTFNAQTYRPYYEVGNLLSYDSETTPAGGFELVRPIDADTFTISTSGGDKSWMLTKTIGQTTRESSAFNFSIGATASFETPVPFIPDVEVSGDYDSSKLQSATMEVADENGLLVQFGVLDGTIAGVEYKVTPYLYWTEMGVLVLDYGVSLPLGTPTIPSFWTQHYSHKPDPTFILPWRLDPEKGQAVTDIQRYLTRDISTLPVEPRPGETVTVQARVSNFSLLNVGSEFKCHFYYGNPLQDGLLIHEATVPAGLEERGKHLLEFDWVVPREHLFSTFNIFCVIDPNDEIDEIHEDNNFAFGEIFLRLTP